MYIYIYIYVLSIYLYTWGAPFFWLTGAGVGQVGDPVGPGGAARGRAALPRRARRMLPLRYHGEETQCRYRCSLYDTMVRSVSACIGVMHAHNQRKMNCDAAA
jgi:hypothetical protein